MAAGTSFLQGSGGLQTGGTTQTTAGTPQNAAGTLRLQNPGAIPNLPTQQTVNANQVGINQAVSANNSLSAQIAALEKQIAAANQQVYAPNLDLAAVNAQARSAAENNVNPYYTKQLNDFVAQQTAQKAQQQQATDIQIKNLQDQLAQTQQANTVTGQRATEDTATKEAQAAQATDQRQTDQGTSFDQARTQQALQLAQGGLTGSGLAAQQEVATQTAHDTTETRQAQADQDQKNATELAKARTFEDLASSNTLAQTAEGKGEKSANINLDNFIQNQGFDLNNQKNSLETQRLQAVATEQSNQAKLLINNFINSIANPAQRQAAIKVYGGAF